MPVSQTLLFPDPRPLVERLGRDFFRQLTERPGVYLMRDAQENVLYVGKARNLRQRLRSYRVANPDRLARRHLRLLRAVARIELLECPDETAALAKEAELLLALKPKFNRAGVWPATPRFLTWHAHGQTLELAITETTAPDHPVFGPFGSSVIHLRAALVRLLWYAFHPATGSATLPAGWLRGRLEATAAIPTAPLNASAVETILTKLFAGDTNGFVAWLAEQTQSLAQPHDLALREADLETVARFMASQTRPTRTFVVSNQRDQKTLPDLLPFSAAPAAPL